MGTQRPFVVLVVVLVISVGLAGVATQGTRATSLQSTPPMSLTDVDVTVDVGTSRSVDATYRIRISESQADYGGVTGVSGTLWQFPGHPVDNLTASVDGVTVTANTTRLDQHSRVRVPLREHRTAGTVVVRLRYDVDGPDGRVRAPLWVPGVRTAGGDRVVTVRTRLPEGTAVSGPVFPAPDVRGGDSQLLVTRLPHVPGFVALRYGTDHPPLSVDQLVVLVGAGVLVGLAGAWLRYGDREDPDVD